MLVEISGIPKGGENSVGIIADSVFYLSNNGVYKYNGSFSTLLSSKILPCANVSSAVDRDKYYILSGNRVWVYFPEKNIWYCENGENIRRILICEGKRSYFKDEGIYVSDIGSATTDWSLVTQNIFDDNVIFPLSLKLRVDSEQGFEYSVFISKDNGEFKSVKRGYFEGNGMIDVVLPHSKCNQFKIKLMGRGSAKTENILIKYRRK
jgi:hypothetical protein